MTTLNKSIRTSPVTFPIANTRILVLLGIAIVVTIMLLLFDPPQDSPVFTVARIADATRLIRAAQSQAEIDTLLATAVEVPARYRCAGGRPPRQWFLAADRHQARR
jgi:hypothetical protein